MGLGQAGDVLDDVAHGILVLSGGDELRLVVCVGRCGLGGALRGRVGRDIICAIHPYPFLCDHPRL